MGKEKALTTNSGSSSAGGGSVLSEFFHFSPYKPSQGKIVRQATFVGLALFVAIGCYKLGVQLSVGSWSSLQYPVPLALLLAGWWVCYRVVNLPRFADFLIAVQAEMNKVSWPTKQELVRSSIVVIVVIFLLAVLLFGFDMLWMFIFQWMGVLRKPGS